MIVVLFLLILPLARCAPPLHSHTHTTPLPGLCNPTICRVSDQSLDSALSTFFCSTKEEISAMVETDKKRALATAISPYLEGLLEEELIAMDSEALVSLVNLVLHKGSEITVRKTKEQHLEDLIKSVARMNNLGMNPNKNVDPILLGLISCQSQTIAEIDELFEFYKAARHGERLRDGRGNLDDFEDFSQDFENEMEFQLVNSPLRTWPSDETELRKGKNWFSDAWDSTRQFVTGEDGRCGYRRRTYCLTRMNAFNWLNMARCADAATINISENSAETCFERLEGLFAGSCKVCALKYCQDALPSEYEHLCDDLYKREY